MFKFIQYFSQIESFPRQVATRPKIKGAAEVEFGLILLLSADEVESSASLSKMGDAVSFSRFHISVDAVFVDFRHHA